MIPVLIATLFLGTLIVLFMEQASKAFQRRRVRSAIRVEDQVAIKALTHVRSMSCGHCGYQVLGFFVPGAVNRYCTCSRGSRLKKEVSV